MSTKQFFTYSQDKKIKLFATLSNVDHILDQLVEVTCSYPVDDWRKARRLSRTKRALCPWILCTAMLELHVWGPGFGLPSIDAECLAAIQYLRNALPKESWVLVPSSNPYLNPFHRLPALHDNTTWIAGFEQICEHLSDISNGAWNIDHDLNETQTATRDAYTSFIYAKGFPLLDLSFYVSSENYATCTRSALAEIIPWPQSWITPHRLRERARTRSEHLGMSALDVDAAQEAGSKTEGLTAQIPKSLRKSKQTVSDLFGHGVQKTRFRLIATTDDFFEPLDLQLKGREWLVADSLTSVDCLLSAVLDLMRVSDLPQAWLYENLEAKYPTLQQWASSHSLSLADRSTVDPMTTKGVLTRVDLSWKVPAPMSWAEAGRFAIETIVGGIPIIRMGYECHDFSNDPRTSKPGNLQKQELYARVRDRQWLYSRLAIACMGATSAIGWMMHAGLVVAPHLNKAKPIRRNFGEAGAILGL